MALPFACEYTVITLKGRGRFQGPSHTLQEGLEICDIVFTLLRTSWSRLCDPLPTRSSPNWKSAARPRQDGNKYFGRNISLYSRSIKPSGVNRT